MIVTMMRMIEVATTRLIVESEEDAATPVTFLTVVSFIIVLAFSVDIVVGSFIIIEFSTAVIKELVVSSVVTGNGISDLSNIVVGSVVVGCSCGVVGDGVMMVSGGQVEPLA